MLNVMCDTPLIPFAVDKPLSAEQFVGTTSGAAYTVSSWIMKVVDWILGVFGLDHNETIVTVLYSVTVLAVAMVVGYLAKWVILRVVTEISKRWSNDTYNALTGANFFTKICRIIPALVFLALIEFTLSSKNHLADALSKFTLIYIMCVTAMALTALVMAVWQHVDTRENKRRLPLNGLAQLIKGAIWIITGIVVIAILVGKSPGSLLAGLGAFAAVLMLIFKDSILGLVAGVQLSENDGLHVGDWISVAGTNANGTVTEVNLTSIKIQNWDKTTTSVPPYSLISGSFTNYRSMQVSNTRRVCRSYMIDADSVLPATPQMLDDLRKVPFMDAYITTKLQQKAEGKEADVNNPAGLVNGTIDTNLGLFRAYMKMWIDANPHVSHKDDCFISTLAQTSVGIPLQVYCFANTSAWFAYEAIQDSIFEHLAAMLPVFQLYTFEYASGRDTITNGYLSPGGDIDTVFGVPYPFFASADAPDGPASTRVPQKPESKPTSGDGSSGAVASAKS